MQQNSESTSSTDELTLQRLNILKEKASDFLNKKDIRREELIKISSELRLQPLIDIEVKDKLLNIMFSYIQDNEQIEYVLLSTIPLQVYELVASKGKNCFKEQNYDLDKNFLSSDRNMAQIGLAYQENIVTQLNAMINGKELEAPTIMYYLHHEECNKLFKSSVFNKPENFLDLKYTLKLGFHGYNEIDHSFILKEDIELGQNFIFNKSTQI